MAELTIAEKVASVMGTEVLGIQEIVSRVQQQYGPSLSYGSVNTILQNKGRFNRVSRGTYTVVKGSPMSLAEKKRMALNTQTMTFTKEEIEALKLPKSAPPAMSKKVLDASKLELEKEIGILTMMANIASSKLQALQAYESSFY